MQAQDQVSIQNASCVAIAVNKVVECRREIRLRKSDFFRAVVTDESFTSISRLETFTRRRREVLRAAKGVA